MEILYFGNIVDKELYEFDKKRNKAPYRVAQYNYEKAFCDEMSKRNNLKIVSLYQQEYFPKRKICFFRKKYKYINKQIEYIKYINIPFIKEIFYFVNTIIKILFWNFKTRKIKNRYIFANLHYAPVSLGIVLTGKLLKIKKVIAFTDLSLYTYSEEKIKKMKIYKKMVIKPYLKLINKLQKSYDLYILFSKQMNNIVNPNNKPFLVMEGIYNPEGLNLKKVEKKHAITYAGKLNKEMGIKKILEIFKTIKDEKLELWLLGNGDMVDEIIENTKKDNRIKYLGFKERNEVFKYLKSSKLLINLRNPNDEYTKYSFPSKTFEYMVSGTPIISTKLEGIPEEYYKYIFSVPYNDKLIKEKIEEILKIHKNKLEKLGNDAREFVLKNKSPEKQVQRIENFLAEMAAAEKGTLYFSAKLKT